MVLFTPMSGYVERYGYEVIKCDEENEIVTIKRGKSTETYNMKSTDTSIEMELSEDNQIKSLWTQIQSTYGYLN